MNYFERCVLKKSFAQKNIVRENSICGLWWNVCKVRENSPLDDSKWTSARCLFPFELIVLVESSIVPFFKINPYEYK